MCAKIVVTDTVLTKLLHKKRDSFLPHMVDSTDVV